MSARATTWVWEHSESRGLDRLVLLAIADEANHRGEQARASLEDLSSKSKVAKSTVQGCTKRLESLGELEVTVQGNGRGRATVYALKGMRKGTSDGTLPSEERYANVPGAVRSGNGLPPPAVQGSLVLSPPQQGSLTLSPQEAPPLSGADAPTTGGSTSNTKILVSYWVSECLEHGWKPMQTWCDVAAKELATIRSEKPEELIRSAIRIAADERKHPGRLPHVIADLEAGRSAHGKPA
jgi:hypothetical protein